MSYALVGYAFLSGFTCGGIVGALAVLLPIAKKGDRRWVRDEERA